MLRSGNGATRGAGFGRESKRENRATRVRPAIERLEDRRLLSAGTLVGATRSVSFTVGPMAADPGRNIVYIADNSDQLVIAVNTDTGNTANVIKLAANSTGLAVSPDDSRLYVAESTADQIEVFSLPSGSLLKTLSVGESVNEVAALANNRIASLANGGIEIFNGDTGASLYNLPADYDGEIKASLDGTVLYSRLRGLSGGAGPVSQWNVSGTGAPVGMPGIPGPAANSTDFTVDPTLGRAYLTDGGVYGITEVNISSGAQTFWPYLIGPYGISVAERPGSNFVYGMSYGDIEQFNQNGTVLNTYSFNGLATKDTLVITPNGNLMLASGGTLIIIGISNLSINATPPGPPVVSSDPSSQTIAAGNQASFTAYATGIPAPTVQWQISTDGTHFSNISGATSTTYSFTATDSENGDDYRAVFTNSYGSVTTTAAQLTVADMPVVTTQPVDQSVIVGQSVTLTAAATGRPTPTAQWQISTDGKNFANIPGASSTTYTFTASASQNGDEFRVIFTNSQGSILSDAATLTVNLTPTAPSITAQPTDQTVQDGQNATFVVGIGGSPTPAVQWQVSTDGTTFADIPGATSASYSFTASANQNGNEFRAVLTNSQGTTTSNPAKLTVPAVNAPPPPFVAAFGTLSLPARAVIGGTLKGKVPVSITNTGSGSLSGGFTFDLYADPGVNFGGGQLLTHISKNLSLRSGQSKVINVNLKSIPAGLTAGLDYPAMQITDPQGDSNVATSTQAFQLAPPIVSLAVVPGAVTPASGGASRTISVAITNTGNVSATGPLQLTLSPSSDDTTPVSGVVLAQTTKNVRLRVNLTIKVRLHFKVSAGMPSGTFFPYLTAKLGSVTQTGVGSTEFTI